MAERLACTQTFAIQLNSTTSRNDLDYSASDRTERNLEHSGLVESVLCLSLFQVRNNQAFVLQEMFARLLILKISYNLRRIKTIADKTAYVIFIPYIMK
jgi:hypothetical protein